MAELFNKEALSALDEHNEAEEMARIASPKLKIVLGAMLAMVAVAVYWCAFGTVNDKVMTQGIVFPFERVTPVSIPLGGIVDQVLVKPGQQVKDKTALLTILHATDTTTIVAAHHGVVLNTPMEGDEVNAQEPVVWLLPDDTEANGREILCYVTFENLRKLKPGQQVQVTPADLQRENWGYAYGEIVGIEKYPTTKQEIRKRLKLDPLAAFIADGQAVYEVRVILAENSGDLVWSREKSKGLKVGTGTLCNVQIITAREHVWRVLIGAVDNALESITGK